MKICFASHNKNKIAELRRLLGDGFELIGLDDLGITEEIPETGTTLEENAFIKADYVVSRHQIACFADDTGLEVDELNGAPGVWSARYAGPEGNAQANMDKLLQALEHRTNRKARFRTVVAYFDGAQLTTFEGILNGEIATEPSGDQGFGYDPIFIPEGASSSLGEFRSEEKNKISHRGIAIGKFAEFMRNQN